MIPLNIQIKSIIYSFFYGIIFSILTNLNYKFIFYSKPIFKFILNILFVLDNVFLYQYICSIVIFVFNLRTENITFFYYQNARGEICNRLWHEKRIGFADMDVYFHAKRFGWVVCRFCKKGWKGFYVLLEQGVATSQPDCHPQWPVCAFPLGG